MIKQIKVFPEVFDRPINKKIILVMYTPEIQVGLEIWLKLKFKHFFGVCLVSETMSLFHVPCKVCSQTGPDSYRRKMNDICKFHRFGLN